MPLSNHVYVYGLNNPVLYTDAPGTCSGPGCPKSGSDVGDDSVTTGTVVNPPPVWEPYDKVWREPIPPRETPPSTNPQRAPSGPGFLPWLIRICGLASLLTLQGDTPQGQPPISVADGDEGVQVVIHRNLDGDPSKDKSYFKKPITSPSQFRLDSDGVSTFELYAVPGNKPYMVTYNVWIKANYKPGDEGIVMGSQVYNGTHCTARYTPEHGGAGHWSVNCSPRDETPVILSTLARRGVGPIVLNPKWVGPPLDRRFP